MDEQKKEIENLKTEIAGLKTRLKRIEEYLLKFPDIGDYIHKPITKIKVDGLDELFEESKKIVQAYDYASASLLQRRLSIGYSRASRILDQLTAAKIIGYSEGSKPREVFENTANKIYEKAH